MSAETPAAPGQAASPLLSDNQAVMDGLMVAMGNPGKFLNRAAAESYSSWQRRAIVEHIAPLIVAHAARQPQPAPERFATEALVRFAGAGQWLTITEDGTLDVRAELLAVKRAVREVLAAAATPAQPDERQAPELAAAIQDIIDRYPEREPAPGDGPTVDDFYAERAERLHRAGERDAARSDLARVKRAVLGTGTHQAKIRKILAIVDSIPGDEPQPADDVKPAPELADSRPATMLQPVTFDDSADENELRHVVPAPAADRLVRDVLESLCRRDGLSLESTVVPGEPARNYALAERLGIGHVFGLPDVPQAAPGMVPLDPAVLHQEVHRLSRQAEAVKALARQHALGDTPRADLARAVLEQLGES